MLNKTDSALVTALNDDGRASQRELASSTKVALGTVSNHLKKLESEKEIRGYLPDIDPEKVVLMTGYIKPEKRAELWKSSKVIIATPQTLSNDVINKKINLEEIKDLKLI